MITKKIAIALLSIGFALSLTACEEEPAVKKEEPVKIVYNPAKAQEIASKRIISVDIDSTPFPSGSDYIRLVAGKDHTNLDASFLKDVTSDETKSAVILGHIANGEKLKLPAVPLFIFEKQSNNWVNIFQATGNLTPLFVAQRAPLSVSLEIVLLKDALSDLDTDAQKLINAYATNLALYSKDGAHEISKLADEFAQRIGLVEEVAMKEVSNFTISYLESYATALNLVNDAGEITLTTSLSVQGQASVLPLHHNQPPQYSALLSHKIGNNSARDALADLEAGFWSVPTDVLHPTCQAVYGALKERLGLSDKDSALVLWRMMQPHALYARNIDYITQCSGEDLAAQLLELGFILPPTKTTRPSSKSQNAMNKSLSAIATLIKNTKDSSEERLGKLMADTVLIRDQARLLFSAEANQIISSAIDVVAPTLERSNAAEYIMMLPIQSYGCYSRGTGQVGNHRASLVKLENDPSLWLLDFAFNKENKINGIQLRTATQRDFCRAIGGRKGKNRCAFSGKSFPGLTPDKCG